VPQQFVYNTWWGHGHGVYAVSFVVFIGLVAAFHLDDTMNALPVGRRNHYQSIFRTTGALMVLLPLTAFACTWKSYLEPYQGWFLELSSSWAFGYYWYQKDLQIQEAIRTVM
jgi:ABC-type sugar transport system permease subunit